MVTDPQGYLNHSTDRHNVFVSDIHSGDAWSMDLPSHVVGYVFTGNANVTTSVD